MYEYRNEQLEGKMKANAKIVLLSFIISLLHQLSFAVSQTESYLKALAPTRQQAYEKINKYLRGPQDPNKDASATNPLRKIDSQAFEPFINNAIEVERQNPDYFALYHAADKAGILLTLLRTYLHQQEHGWDRDDFFILRHPSYFYDKSAPTAQDYIKQNMPLIMSQFHAKNKADLLKNPCKRPDWDNCIQFDFDPPPRFQLISTSPSFVAGVDDTDIVSRRMTDQNWAALESSFYYFITNLSWSPVRALYPILVSDLKKQYPTLFEDSEINTTVRKYIAIKFAKIIDLLIPHAAQQLTTKQKAFEKDAGMMFQFLIPKNIIDNVVYLSWANGIPWQRTINGIKDGWSDEIGAYTKISPILQIMQDNPEKLGRSINLFQTRIILKDKQYFYDASSPIKINLIHGLPTSLFRVLQDFLKVIAKVVVENNKAISNGNQKTWFEQSNIRNEVEKYDAKIKAGLASNQVEQQIEAMDALYYYGLIGTEIPLALQQATKFKDSRNAELQYISKSILKTLAAKK